MEHHGHKLRDMIKAKGFSMIELASKIGVTRAAIDKHVRNERLTRKVLKPYAEPLDFTLDEFFEDTDFRDMKSANESNRYAEPPTGATVPAEIHQELQRRYFELQERYNELVMRFFPNAVQQVGIITA